MQTQTLPVGYVTAGVPNVGVYFACLSSYNSGTLHGCWVDLSPMGATTAEEINDCIAAMLANSPEPGAEEWAMHDSNGIPFYLSRNEWPDLATLAEFAETLSDLSADEEIPYVMLCNDRHAVVSVDSFREAFCGVYDSPEDYAEELAADMGIELSGFGWPLNHIDWAAAWHDLDCDGYSAEYSSEAGGYVIFRDF